MILASRWPVSGKVCELGSLARGPSPEVFLPSQWPGFPGGTLEWRRYREAHGLLGEGAGSWAGKSPWMEMETKPHHQHKRQGLSSYAGSPGIFQVSLWLGAEGTARLSVPAIKTEGMVRILQLQPASLLYMWMLGNLGSQVLWDPVVLPQVRSCVHTSAGQGQR